MGGINEIQAVEERCVAAITPVVGQKEQVQKKKKKKRDKFSNAREEKSHPIAV